MKEFYILASLISLAIKIAVGRWGHSGKGNHPMYGDFEAQRHWMEITVSTPIGDWYRNTADNNLQYWGLDYPPVTAYVSWIYGMIANYAYPDLVRLHTSRGFEKPTGIVFMRVSVILADIIIIIPAIICSLQLLVACKSITFSANSSNKANILENLGKRKMSYFLLLVTCLLCPTAILVDHGHFQYNGVCIGLSLLSAGAILHNMDIAGSILFCLSLNFKQMALYYAPVFFFVLLRKCIDKPTILQSIIHFIRIGFTVIVIFASLWWPFCFFAAESETCLSSLLLVLSRQFPFSRGIFEDKVSNIWYCASVIIDFRQHFSVPQMAQMSLCLTLLLICPVAVDILRKKVTPTRLFLSLLNCSMAFFLASFQVHEKSLLLPLIPAMLLLPHHPLLMGWFQLLGTFTMFPLLIRDGLRIPCFAVNVMFVCVFCLYLDSEKVVTTTAVAEGEKKEEDVTVENHYAMIEGRLVSLRDKLNAVEENKERGEDISENKVKIKIQSRAGMNNSADKEKKIAERREKEIIIVMINEMERLLKEEKKIVDSGKEMKEIEMLVVSSDQDSGFPLSIPKMLLWFIVGCSVLGMSVLHVLEACILPPQRYPDIYPALFSLFGAANLLVVYVIGVYWQLSCMPST